jgi:hypothetical protein
MFNEKMDGWYWNVGILAKIPSSRIIQMLHLILIMSEPQRSLEIKSSLYI